MGKNSKVPFVFGSTLKEKIITLSYDFYLFIQLLLFYFVSLTIGSTCYLLDRLFHQNRFLNGLIAILEKIGGMTQKQ